MLRSAPIMCTHTNTHLVQPREVSAPVDPIESVCCDGGESPRKSLKLLAELVHLRPRPIHHRTQAESARTTARSTATNLCTACGERCHAPRVEVGSWGWFFVFRRIRVAKGSQCIVKPVLNLHPAPHRHLRAPPGSRPFGAFGCSDSPQALHTPHTQTKL